MSDPRTKKLRDLVVQGVSVRAAARAAGLPHTTAARIMASGPDVSPQYPPSAPYGPSMITPGPANIPAPAWATDQPPPPPVPVRFREGYHDKTFRSFSAPLAFEGWTVDRMRNAIAVHDNGVFLESSLLAIASTRFGPVLAALSQRIAPALSLNRHVRAGLRGVSAYIGAEVEAQLVPRAGLLPSPYFPENTWGSIAIDLAMMGFAVLQHVYGEPDPETGVRPVYTRRWPTWAVQYYRYRRCYVAITSEGPVDIISGDGKFTLIADREEPHFTGAIRALGVEVLDGMLAKQARANYIDLYGAPKLVGTMPQGTGVRTPEGDDFFTALQDVRNPDGVMVLPNGAKLDFVKLAGETSGVFKDSLESVWAYVAAILLGSDGTMTRGSGVYSAPIFAGVRRDLIATDLAATVRGINAGHVAPWLAVNYSRTIEAARAAGEWVEPVLEIPLPDPDSDARIKSHGDRLAALVAQVQAERAAGFVVTQERVQQLADTFDVQAPTLADVSPVSLTLAPADVAKAVRVDEARAAQGLGPIGDERGMRMLADVDTAPKGPDPRAEDPANPAEALLGGELITEPLPDEAAARLAEDMSAHQIERCEHGSVNRCRLCGIERERELVPPSVPGGSDYSWRIRWRPIARPVPAPAPSAAPVPGAPPAEAPSGPDTPGPTGPAELASAANSRRESDSGETL